MSKRASHGSANWWNSTFANWRLAVDEIVCAEMPTSVEEIDEVVTRDRIARWFSDGMSAAMAADSVKSWIRLSRPHRRSEHDAQSLRALIANGAKS